MIYERSDEERSSGLGLPLTSAMMGLVILAMTACDTRAGRDFKEAKAAYMACVNAKGAAACEGQRAVMETTGNIYASSSGRPPAMGTVVVPR